MDKMELTKIIGKVAYESHMFLEDNLKIMYSPLQKYCNSAVDIGSSFVLGFGVIVLSPKPYFDLLNLPLLALGSCMRFIDKHVPDNFSKFYSTSFAPFLATYNSIIGFGQFGVGIGYMLSNYENSEQVIEGAFMATNGLNRLGASVPALLFDKSNGPKDRNKKRKEKIKELSDSIQSSSLSPSYKPINRY